MSKSIKPADFRNVLNEILEEYGDDINDLVVSSAKKTVRKAVRTLKSKANGSFESLTGDYRSGWTSKVEEGRLSVSARAYNKTDYQLTHLLEFGHVLVTGGRTKGRVKAFPHIAPVNDQAQKDFMEYIEKGLSK